MKKFASLLCLLLLLAVCLTASAQTPAPTVQPADEDSVVRITTNLIQIDAVVTDKDGKLVTNLRPEDFELLVNGKPQKLTNFSLVTVEPISTAEPAPRTLIADKNGTPLPPVRLRSEEVKRTIALVVDDLTLSYESMSYVKKSLKKFVDEQMQPGDLVAILRTGSGVSALQQFTSDKRQLYAAIESIKYNQAVGRIMSFYREIEGAYEGETKIPSGGRGIVLNENPDKYRDDMLATASLAAAGYIIQGMRGLPGRKAVMLLTEGFTLVDPNYPSRNARLRQAFERLVDSSNRAGVVIYSMDARGLVAEGLVGEDASKTTKASQEIPPSLTNRERFNRPLDGMQTLSEQTGGFAIYNSNDLGSGIKQALDDQKSYYLLGFQPEASAFDPAKARFNHLIVKVKGNGLKVRYRSGFFGIKDEDAKPVVNTPEQQVMRALTSPFASNDISLRLTPLFGNDARAGSYVRSLVHISIKGLTFTEKPGGLRESVINIVAYTFGEDGRVVDSVGETHTISLTDALYQRAQTSGLVYSLNMPIKRAGAYQLRVAVRDDKSSKVGSASQFINIPDIKKSGLALSGIALSSADTRQGKTNAANQQSTEAASTSMLTQAAMRRFRTGHLLQFAYAIYNAKLDKSTKQPRLVTQLKLFRDGKEIYSGQPAPFDLTGQADFQHLLAEGGLQLGGLQAGEYVLQVTVTDLLVTGKSRTAANWIDFEVEK